MLKNRKGQSSIEYILLFGAVIGVMIALLANDGIGIRQNIEDVYTNASAQVVAHGNALNNSRRVVRNQEDVDNP